VTKISLEISIFIITVIIIIIIFALGSINPEG